MPRGRQYILAPVADEVVRKYQSDKKSTGTIAAEYGVSRGCVRSLLISRGIVVSGRRKRHRCLDEFGPQIVQDYGGGLSIVALADKYKVHYQTIQKVLRYHGIRVYLGLGQRADPLAMTTEAYARLLALQGNACAICRKPFADGRSKNGPQVDHDHTTGYVRGVLCGRCNSALGHFYDSIENLCSAIAYLVRSWGVTVWGEVHAQY